MAWSPRGNLKGPMGDNLVSSPTLVTDFNDAVNTNGKSQAFSVAGIMANGPPGGLQAYAPVLYLQSYASSTGGPLTRTGMQITFDRFNPGAGNPQAMWIRTVSNTSFGAWLRIVDEDMLTAALAVVSDALNAHILDTDDPHQTVTQDITDGDTTHSPSGDAVFDALIEKADDSSVVHNTGSETIAGSKTFTSQLRSTSQFPLVDLDPSGAGRVAYVGGWSNTGHFVVYESPGSANFRELSVHYTNGPRWDGNDIWHAGNMPAGSGTYVPTCDADVNVASCTGGTCNWARVGNSLMISGTFEATPSVANSASRVKLSLPVTTTFTTGDDAGGTATGKTVPGPNYAYGYVSTSPGEGKITVLFFPDTTGNYNMRFNVVVPIA